MNESNRSVLCSKVVTVASRELEIEVEKTRDKDAFLRGAVMYCDIIRKCEIKGVRIVSLKSFNAVVLPIRLINTRI